MHHCRLTRSTTGYDDAIICPDGGPNHPVPHDTCAHDIAAIKCTNRRSNVGAHDATFYATEQSAHDIAAIQCTHRRSNGGAHVAAFYETEQSTHDSAAILPTHRGSDDCAANEDSNPGPDVDTEQIAH